MWQRNLQLVVHGSAVVGTAAWGGCRGPAAADQPSIGMSSPSYCLPRGQQLSQLPLPQKYVQALLQNDHQQFAVARLSPFSAVPWEHVWFLHRQDSGWRGKEKGAFAAAAAATGIRGGLGWAEPENESICLLLH